MDEKTLGMVQELEAAALTLVFSCSDEKTVEHIRSKLLGHYGPEYFEIAKKRCYQRKKFEYTGPTQGKNYD